MFTGKATQLTVYFGESDQYHSQALYAAMLEMLRLEGCGGATATRGIAGFGASSGIHTSAILRLSIDLPIVITVVDRPERIERILPRIREMAPGALITLAGVEVVQSGAPLIEGLPDVKVSEVMRREVIAVRPDSSITEVVHLLLDKDFTAVPVLDDRNRVIGIVSDSDLLRRGGVRVTLSLKRATDPDFVAELHKSLSDSALKVAEVMTREVITIGPDTSLGRAAR